MSLQRQSGAISLLMTSIVMMVVTSLALAFFYFMRYGELPFHDALLRWTKSGDAISAGIKDAANLRNPIGQTITADSEVRRCTIKGKVVFSNTDCLDTNTTTRTVKLIDNKGFEPPKAPASSGENQASGVVDLREQLINKQAR
ncbi:hypothetical protein [Undibacterium sp. RuTC16W]|uniref:hypothetical protein n=1 Tax=Undibacterium sp. RuTC16W TaxID=3413048 RepID=UPI003BF2AABE